MIMACLTTNSHGMRLGSLIGFGTKVGCGRAALREVARENGLDDSAEDDLRAAGILGIRVDHDGS